MDADLLDNSKRRARLRRVREVWKPNHWFPDERIYLVHSVAPNFYRRGDTTWSIVLDEESETDLTETIQKKLRIRKTEAAAIKDKLYEEIDQIAQARNVERFSSNEKDQLVLAIIKTADSLLKKTLDTK
ncbi:MAG: hypothetical protein WCD81_07470 [Candidatus Bathyarchaeia archaeon]